MNPNFKKFLKNNKKIIEQYNSKEKILLIDRGRFGNAIFGTYLAGILNKKLKLDCIVISDKEKDKDIIKFYRSFGFFRFIKVFNYKEIIFSNIFLTFLTINYTILYFLISHLRGFEWMINNLKIKNIIIGDLIYDTYIRTEHKFINPNFDLKLLNIFFKAIFRTLKILKLFDTYKVKCVIVGTYTYAYNDAISIRIAVEKKIVVLEATENVLLNYNNKILEKGHDYCLIEKNLDKIRKIKSIKKINIFLKNRALGKQNLKHTRNLDITSQVRKKKIDKKILFNKIKINSSRIKKIILIAPHKFSESPHARGKLIFRDYYDQFIKTLYFINKFKRNDILWLFKPHPSSKEFNEERIVSNKIKKLSNPRIKLAPKEFNSYQLSKVCDNVITSRGTIGLEFACIGKIPLITGQTVYSNRGFTLEPKNQNKYFSIIKNIDKIKPLSKSKTELAKKILYFLENYKLDMKNSEINLSLEEGLNAKKNYFKFLNRNLLKKEFKEDIYFKQLKQKINLIFKN